MDINFKCPNCEQELTSDAAGAGTQIECPSCGQTITIPEPSDDNIAVVNPIAHSAAAREEKHFSVPQHSDKGEALITKPLPPLEAQKEGDKTIRITTFKRSDCVEVGKDRFDEKVTQFLRNVGQENILHIYPINYSHKDLASGEWITDFGAMIIYKG